MIHSASFFCLCLLLSSGVFGDSDEVKSVSVMEGDSVTLNSGVTEIQTDDHIVWMFGPQETRIAGIVYDQMVKYFNSEIFRDRLQMDNQTGSLTIRNIRSEHTGLYKLQIFSNRGTSYKRFNITVYARLPVPVITRNSSSVQNPSSSSSSSVSRCSVVCSAVNVSHVTLSWFKGNSLLSSISVSDLSISLSLPLEIQCLDDSYSCVVSYSFINRTTHLNITDLCHPCPVAQRSSFMMAIPVTLALLVVIAVVGGWMCHRTCKQPGKIVKTHNEEILYADTTFCTHPLQSTDVVAEDHTVYSTVKT